MNPVLTFELDGTGHCLHTDAIQTHLIPAEITAKQAAS